MGIFARLSHKIGDNLVRSNVIKEEDAEIYIYGINQIFVAVLNVSSALIIGWIFGVMLEIAVFMAAYIPLRTFAGGYHAKTPLRCYFFSVVMLIIVSVGIKCFSPPDLAYVIAFLAGLFVVVILSPIEDKNKLLNETENKVYKRRTIIITFVESTIGILFKLLGLNGFFASIMYSFVVLGIMLILGKIKNCALKKRSNLSE